MESLLHCDATMGEKKDDYLGKGFPITVNAFPIPLATCRETQYTQKQNEKNVLMAQFCNFCLV